MGCPPEGGEEGTLGFDAPHASVPLSQRGSTSRGKTLKCTWMMLSQSS